MEPVPFITSNADMDTTILLGGLGSRLPYLSVLIPSTPWDRYPRWSPFVQHHVLSSQLMGFNSRSFWLLYFFYRWVICIRSWWGGTIPEMRRAIHNAFMSPTHNVVYSRLILAFLWSLAWSNWFMIFYTEFLCWYLYIYIGPLVCGLTNPLFLYRYILDVLYHMYLSQYICFLIKQLFSFMCFI